MKKWLFAWVIMCVLFYAVMLRQLSFGGPIETAFSWAYITAFSVIMAFILREIVGKKWDSTFVVIAVVLFVLIMIVADKLIPNIVLPPPTNITCGDAPQVFGYCD